MVQRWKMIELRPIHHTADPDNDLYTGRNGLTRLAIRLFSVIANSAGCERTFSDFGIIHTKHRNHLSPQKVHQMTLVKAFLRRSLAAAGLSHARLKRKFGDLEPEQNPVPSVQLASNPSTGSTAHNPDAIYNHIHPDFRDISRQLIADAEDSARPDPADDDDDDDFVLPDLLSHYAPPPSAGPSTGGAPAHPPHIPSSSSSAQTHPPTNTRRHSRKTQIPLADLFDYPPVRPAGSVPGSSATTSSDAGSESNYLQTFWGHAKHNLDEEIASYDDDTVDNVLE